MLWIVLEFEFEVWIIANGRLWIQVKLFCYHLWASGY
jgi:hypothetical protein